MLANRVDHGQSAPGADYDSAFSVDRGMGNSWMFSFGDFLEFIRSRSGKDVSAG